MSDNAAVTTSNTLSKVGAHLRWLIEKSGVNPENGSAIITIGVRNNEDQSRMIATLLREYDANHMQRTDTDSTYVRVHGVPIFVVVSK